MSREPRKFALARALDEPESVRVVEEVLVLIERAIQQNIDVQFVF